MQFSFTCTNDLASCTVFVVAGHDLSFVFIQVDSKLITLASGSKQNTSGSPVRPQTDDIRYLQSFILGGTSITNKAFGSSPLSDFILCELLQ